MAGLKQQFERRLFNMTNVGTDEQVAGIFIKPFADKTKWNKAVALINNIDCSKDALDNKGSTKDSDSHLLHKCTSHMCMAAPLLTIRTSKNTNNMTGLLRQLRTPGPSRGRLIAIGFLLGFVVILTASLDRTDMLHAVVMLLKSRRSKMLPR